MMKCIVKAMPIAGWPMTIFIHGSINVYCTAASTIRLSLLLLFNTSTTIKAMPSLSNSQPLAPSAPNDMATADCYVRIDQFLNKNPAIKNFKIEDDNHGMGMISTADPNAPKQAINMRLSQSTIGNYLINNGFQPASDNSSTYTRK